MVPPRGMIFIGSGDFERQGRHLADLAIRLTGLRPDGRLLDVGCGIGRLAVPLTAYLSPAGVYEGFDIVRMGIDWCERHISPRYPNFRFRLVELRNDLYNLDTREEARDFRFPYPADYFDSVVLTSVFTHMMPSDVANYLRQIATVLREGGKCMATFFLLTPRSMEAMREGRAGFTFDYPHEGYALMHDTVKEANVAFEEAFLRRMIQESGLTVEAVYPGSWTGLSDGALDFQDVVVLRK